MDKMELYLVPWTTPLLLGLTAFVTFAAVLVGCIYTNQKLKRPEQYKVKEKKGISEDDQEEDSDLEISKDSIKEDIICGAWPVDHSGAKDSAVEEKGRDPIEFCSHIPSEVRKTQQRIAFEEAERAMDEEQRRKEREIQREQLQAIFSLMEQQKDKFGVDSMDDIQDQMKLYTIS